MERELVLQKDNKPKISIIVPVYNAEKTIKRCLDALINQTYSNIEIICVNDGSKDNSLSILEEYAKKDNRVLAFSQENSGPAKTRNFALSKVTGEYLMFCDADDYYELDMCEVMLKTLLEQNVDLVMCDANIIDLADGKLQSKSTQAYYKLKLKGLYELQPNLMFRINVLLWNKIFKTSLAKEVGYPTEFEHDDTVFFLKYYSNIKTYYGIDKCLYNYFVGCEESIMGKVYTKKNKHKYDFLYAYKNLYDYLLNNNKDEKYISVCVAHQFFSNRVLIKYLRPFEKFIFLILLKKFAKEYPIIKTRADFVNLLKIKNVKQLDKYMESGVLDNTSFLNRIFSIKNENNRKVIRILGLKIKLKSKKLEESQVIQELKNTVNFHVKLTRELQADLAFIKNELKELKELMRG